MKNISRNQLISIIVGAIIIAVAFFFIGHAAGNKKPKGFAGPGMAYQGQMGARGGMMRGGGGAMGTILSMDSTSLTLSIKDGGSKIVLLTDATPVMKTSPGSRSDLKTGESVMVTGTTNQDGSISAQSISIRPAGTPPAPAASN
jgi:cytochrome c-type biogenesis protein CcmE